MQNLPVTKAVHTVLLEPTNNSGVKLNYEHLLMKTYSVKATVLTVVPIMI